MSVAWREAAAVVLLLVVAAALLSALRLTLARASRPAIRAEVVGPDARRGRAHAPPPLRTRVLGGLMVGNVILNTAAAAIATARLVTLNGKVGQAYAVAAISALVILAEALARVAVGRDLVSRALRPFGIRIERYAERLSASDEIRGQVDLLHQQGGVVKAERDMLGGLLDLKDLQVSEVMVHRTKMRTIDADLAPDALVRDVLGSPHTRLPVWRDRPENIVGILHAKDLFRAMNLPGAKLVLNLDAIATPPWFVPDTTSLRDQLSAFLTRKQHFALVVDEYGALMGLVTLEDILEEIVGEIADEHDVAARGVRPQPDGSFLVDGALPIRDLNRMMDWSLPDAEATTVAGLVIHEAQTIPEAGQAFTFHGFRFEVMRRVRNRLTAVRVGPAPGAGPGEMPSASGPEPTRSA